MNKVVLSVAVGAGLTYKLCSLVHKKVKSKNYNNDGPFKKINIRRERILRNNFSKRNASKSE